VFLADCAVVCFLDVIALPCTEHQWITRTDSYVLGSSYSFPVASEQECLDYCLRSSDCVGVDLYPQRCLLHTNPSDYVRTIYYYQQGTTSYQLLNRCDRIIPSTMPTTIAPITTTSKFSVRYNCQLLRPQL